MNDHYRCPACGATKTWESKTCKPCYTARQREQSREMFDSVDYWVAYWKRFWSRVEKTPTCWVWTGARLPNGYGCVSFKCQRLLAHRVSFTSMKREIEPQLVLDHLCRNPSCVRPTHLEVVTQRENTLRGIGPAARNIKKTACLRGHPFDVHNTYHNKHGHRICRACHAIDENARYHRCREALS